MPPPRLIHQLLERSAERAPEQPFIIEQDGRSFSYADIDAAANQLATQLLDRGLQRGDRVALLARNAHLYVEAYYAILKAGGVAVPLNTAADAAGVAEVMRMCGAEVLMVGPRMERLVRAGAGQLQAVRLLIAPHAPKLALPQAQALTWERGQAPRPQLEIDDDEVASIIFTSGSTGRPRGATLSHRNIVANVAAICSYLQLTPQDRVLTVLPFYYVYGKSLLNTHAFAGGSVVVENRFQYPQVALDTLEQQRCTGFSGVPSSFAILLERTNFAKRPLRHLRYVTQAGGAMSPALTRRLMQALPNKQIFIMYGATEASARLAYLPPEELPDAVGSIGRAIDGVSLRVLRPDGSECDEGEEGELVARGPNIMRGYWNAPEESARVLDEHGYHTGDLARRDAQGRLYVVGRSKDMIKVGGHRLSSQEVEFAISEHEAVSACAVIGVADPLLGEQLLAFVVLRDGDGPQPDGQALAAFLRGRVPGYKIPRNWRMLDALPKNESGKVMKAQLRAMAEAT